MVRGGRELSTAGSLRTRVEMRSAVAGRTALPHQKALGFVSQQHCGHDKQQADQQRGHAVELGQPELAAQEYPQEGDQQPENRGSVFKQHCKIRGILAGLDRRPQALVGPGGAFQLSVSHTEGQQLRHGGDRQYQIVQHGMLDGPRVGEP